MSIIEHVVLISLRTISIIFLLSQVDEVYNSGVTNACEDIVCAVNFMNRHGSRSGMRQAIGPGISQPYREICKRW